MYKSKKRQSWFPKKFLFRLTFLNIIIVSLFIILSSWAIYNTACFLVEGMGTVDGGRQQQFNSTLFQYLLIFSSVTIVVGSIVHFYLTRKLIRPLRQLIASTKSMAEGKYPEPIEVRAEDDIGQLVKHFNGLVHQLQSNHEQRKKLVSDVSHELRTPLSNLNGYLNALKSGVISGDEALYESLYNESKRLTHMIEQLDVLKEWADIKEQVILQRKKIAIHTLLEDVIHMFQWQAHEKNILLNTYVEPCYLFIAEEGVLQAVTNLVDNALQYSVGNEPITITGKRRKNDYYVAVTGLSEPIGTEHGERIFERFYRVDESRNRETGGSGLGLSITKEIIERHGGEIGYHENANGKTTFWFTLP